MKRDSHDAAADHADQMVVAMNVHAHAKDAFDERAERLGQLFAVPAVVAVHNARILAQTQGLAARFRSALTSRSVIDQAIGVLMSRTGVSAEQAADLLRVLSEREHTTSAAVADRIVRDAVGRAVARHTDKT